MERFAVDGYALLPGLMDRRAVHEISRCVDRSAGTATDDGALRIYRYLAASCAAFREFLGRGPHVSLVDQLVGGPSCVVFDQVVEKFPAGGEATAIPWHQDNGYTSVQPPTNVTLVAALDAMDLASGGLRVFRGSHLAGCMKHQRIDANPPFVMSVSRDATRALEEQGHLVGIPLALGDGVIFSGLLLHSSPGNKGARRRRLAFGEYAHVDAIVAGQKAGDRPFALRTSGVEVADQVHAE